jgi:hypothetical protein
VPTAPPGKRLFIADLSGIEARGAAMICGAVAELEQWRIFDHTGRPEDEPYYRTGISTFAQPAATARKAGKTGALAFQYQGGIIAYRKAARDQETSGEVIAARRDAWRRDHPEYVQFWRLALFQAVQAIRHPGQEFTAKAITFQFDHATGFLEINLPSKRKLTYPCAELIEDEQYGTTSFTFLDTSGSSKGRMYHTRKGKEGGVFGGLLLENVTQALCRDIFVEAMPRLEAAGYPIVMHTHDDYACEVPKDSGSLEEFLAIITTPPSWAPDLPIAAKGRISDRFIEIAESKPEAISVAAENMIDNAAMPEDDEDDENGENDESVEDHASNVESVTIPVTPEPESAHVCMHCQRDPPDGLERASAYNGAWLHPGCEEAFIRARMAEEGLAWQSADFAPISPSPSPTSPSPASPDRGYAGNGGTGSEGFNNFDFDIERLLSPKGRSDGYPHGENAGSSAGPATDQYIYKNALGRLHMRVMRTTGKSFPTYYWSGGEWVAGWPKEVVPYRLPELMAATPDILVLVCEGEKDCNTAVRYGFVATTNPGGAKQWQPELAQYFQGKQRVCIMEDNDADGARHTALILKALHGVVPIIGVARFPELPEHGDLTDFFERGGTKAGLLIRIKEALKAGTARPYTLHTLESVPLKAQRWLWRGHLPIGALELTAGKSGIGKGLVLCHQIACITTGRNWPDGSPGAEPGSVIILTAEDRAEDFRRRLTAAGADLSKVHILEYVRRNGRDELFLLAEDLDKLEAACRDIGDVRLIGIDPITAYMGSGRGFDSHRATDVRAQLHPLKVFAEKLDIAVSAITHPPKNASTRSVLDNFIGSQAYIAAARVGHYCIEELGEEDDRGFRRPTGRVLYTVPKSSHSAPVPTLVFRKEVVQLGHDPDTDEPIEVPRLIWEGTADLAAEEAVAANKPADGDGRKAKAAPVREFLRDILATGPVMRNIVVERGAEKGFSLPQLRRALKNVGEPFKQPGEDFNSPWMWALPKDVPANAIRPTKEED